MPASGGECELCMQYCISTAWQSRVMYTLRLWMGRNRLFLAQNLHFFFRKKIFSTRNISSEDQQKLAYASFPTCIEFSQNWEIQPLQPFLSNYVGLKFYSFYYEINVDFFHNCVSFWDVFGLPIEIGWRNNTHINMNTPSEDASAAYLLKANQADEFRM